MKRFTLCDSSIDNRFGFRVLADGIDTTQFMRNPVMLYRHMEEDKDDMPIGRWENTVNANGEIQADAIFDESDPFAAKVKRKVDGDFIRMASVGLIPVEWSDDPKYKLPGQGGPTLIHSILREASITPFGVNYNALRLYDAGGKALNLSELDFNNLIPNDNSEKMNEITKTIAAALNLSDKVSEAEIVRQVLTLSDDFKKVTAELETAKARITELTTSMANAEKNVLLSDAVDKKLITEKEKATLVKLDVEDIKTLLSDRKPAADLPGIGRQGVEENPLLKLSYTELDRCGKLAELKASDPEAFKVKFKEEFKRDYKE